MSTSKKFEIIHKQVNSIGNTLSVTSLCDMASVSRSGYYNWKNSTNARLKREEQDKADFAVILNAYNYRATPKA